jgi:zinc transporter
MGDEMAGSNELAAGTEPGLRFAVVLNGKGGGREVDWRGVRDWKPEDGLLWVHLERDAEETMRWLREDSGIDPFVVETLLAEDSRPRVEPFDDALLLVLRGVNLEVKDEIELVPMHAWIDGNRAITLRDRSHAMSALRDIRVALHAGRGPKFGGGLLVRIAEKTVRDLDPVLDELEEEVETQEDAVVDRASRDQRHDLADIRRRAIHLRRYLGPQRDALGSLRDEDTPLLDERDRMRLAGVIDWINRHLEDLDAIRDRTTILHEDLTATISERIAETTHRFTVIAALLLPPSLVAGVLGANIGGIPGDDVPWAFAVLVGAILLLLVIELAILRYMRWI